MQEDSGEMITSLNATTLMMGSPDYKERFRAEYYQLVIRYKKLKAMLSKWDRGELDYTPACGRGVYSLQESAMLNYMAVLEKRAELENIEVDSDYVWIGEE
jgi:hypothetical protein